MGHRNHCLFQRHRGGCHKSRQHGPQGWPRLDWNSSLNMCLFFYLINDFYRLSWKTIRNSTEWPTSTFTVSRCVEKDISPNPVKTSASFLSSRRSDKILIINQPKENSFTLINLPFFDSLQRVFCLSTLQPLSFCTLLNLFSANLTELGYYRTFIIGWTGNGILVVLKWTPLCER